MTRILPGAVRGFAPERLFHPATVALSGAGTVVGREILGNLLAGGFGGAILPVLPGAPAISGLLAHPDIASLPLAPDLAIVADPPEQVPGQLAALAARGCFAAIVPTMVPDLAAAARAAGVRVLGPGSFGLIVPALGLDASRGHLPAHPGRLALVSQSAALCRAVLDWAGPGGVGFSHIIGIGGNADIGFAPVLDWLSRDPETRLILLDIRRLRDPRRFLSAARAASRLRPVVALRAGGWLVDPSGRAEALFAQALHRAGVLTVACFEDLLAAAETLARARPAAGDTLAIVTNAIGPGRLAADAALRQGLSLAALPEAVRAALPLALPGQSASMIGPVYAGIEPPTRLAEAASLLGAAPEIGGVLAVHAPVGGRDGAAIAALAAAGATMKVPLLVAALGEATAAAHRRSLADAGVAAFASPEQAVQGFRHLVEQRRNRAAAAELPPSRVLAVAPDRVGVARRFAALRAAGADSLAQADALAVLAAYGVAVLPMREAETAEAAAAAAEALGFPVVVRLPRQGAVAADRRSLLLDLADPPAVEAAARFLLARARWRGEPERVVVQAQYGRAHELLIRLDEDALFGPTIGFGQGGPAAEVVADIALDLPPLNLPLARALIARTRVSRLFGGLRGHPEVPAEAVAEALVRVSQLLVDFPEIAALEINPLFADAAGVHAADASLRLLPVTARAGRSRFAIPPYPAELVETWHAGPDTLTLRPIRPEDALAHGAFFRRMPPEDVRRRFFSALRELSPEMLARLTQVDYVREMALIAVHEASGETVGVARLVRDAEGEAAEFAIAVDAAWKGRGLGRALMRRLIDWARGEGITAITGEVLAENAPMVAFVHSLGFTTGREPDAEDVLAVRLGLAGPAVSPERTPPPPG